MGPGDICTASNIVANRRHCSKEETLYQIGNIVSNRKHCSMWPTPPGSQLSHPLEPQQGCHTLVAFTHWVACEQLRKGLCVAGDGGACNLGTQQAHARSSGPMLTASPTLTNAVRQNGGKAEGEDPVLPASWSQAFPKHRRFVKTLLPCRWQVWALAWCHHRLVQGRASSLACGCLPCGIWDHIPLTILRIRFLLQTFLWGKAIRFWHQYLGITNSLGGQATHFLVLLQAILS